MLSLSVPPRVNVIDELNEPCAAVVALVSRAFLMMSVVAGNMMVALVAWLVAHRRARAYAVPLSEVRVASLVPRDTSLPGGVLFAAGPFAILLATAVLAYAYRDVVPDGPGTMRSSSPLAFAPVIAARLLF